MNKHVKGLVNVLTSIPKGLRVTMTNMVRTKNTQRYPEVMPEPVGQGRQADPGDPFDQPYRIAPRYRGLHGLTVDPDTGDLNCIGCQACAKVCPDDLISMDLEKREGHNGRYPVTFTVNIGPCCFCGLCAEVCPTPMRAIVMTDLFEWATYARDGRNLVLTKDDLERNGAYEVERRKAGRQWDEHGELIGINPEEEGNPYFQFAIESGKADRMPKQGEEKAARAPKAEAEPAPVPAPAPAAPAAPAPTGGEAGELRAKLLAVLEQAGVAAPDEPEQMALTDLDVIEDRKLCGQAKSALRRLQKALGLVA
jgi:NADH-quinone oxidoreductase subunit I